LSIYKEGRIRRPAVDSGPNSRNKSSIPASIKNSHLARTPVVDEESENDSNDSASQVDEEEKKDSKINGWELVRKKFFAGENFVKVVMEAASRVKEMKQNLEALGSYRAGQNARYNKTSILSNKMPDVIAKNFYDVDPDHFKKVQQLYLTKLKKMEKELLYENKEYWKVKQIIDIAE